MQCFNLFQILVRLWNRRINSFLFIYLKRIGQKNGKEVKIENHEITVYLLSANPNTMFNDVLGQLENSLNIVRDTDYIKYTRVKRFITHVFISDKIFKDELRYNVYTKSLFIGKQLVDTNSDYLWGIGEIACYMVERATFGKVYYCSDVLLDKSNYNNVSRLLMRERVCFGRKLGEPWNSYYKELPESKQLHTRLFE